MSRPGCGRRKAGSRAFGRFFASLEPVPAVKHLQPREVCLLSIGDCPHGALQLIGRHRAPQAAPLARQLLADPASPIMLVQASAAVLAQCGTPDDLPHLEKQLNTGTPHTRPALAEAPKTLKAKAPCSGGL